MAQRVDFNQIYYKHDHREELFSFATPYPNTSLTHFFENQIIADIIPASRADKIAVCSWALRQKMTNRIPPRRELTAEVLQEDFDVMSFTKNSPDHDMIASLEQWHKGATAILWKIWGELGIVMPKMISFPIYQNAFCATREVYQEYVSKFLIPAMKLMDENEEIKKMCWRDSKYTRTILNKAVDFERINKFLGVSYMPMHPFLLERCFSMWINDKGLKVVYL